MKSSINLKIYDDNNEVCAEFETSRIRWGVIEDAIELTEALEGKSEKESIKAMGQFVQAIFPKLTDELLRQADFNDIKLCFIQTMNVVKSIETGDEKNV